MTKKRPGPAPKFGGISTVKSARLPNDLWRALARECRRQGISQNALMVQTLQRAAARGKWGAAG